MPSLKIFTNLQRVSIPQDIVLRILPILSKAVDKPSEKFMVTIVPDCIQTIGSDAVTPSIVASLESIGHLGPAENKLIAKRVTDFLENEMGVTRDRIFLTFSDLQASDVARNGETIG